MNPNDTNKAFFIKLLLLAGLGAMIFIGVQMFIIKKDVAQPQLDINDRGYFQVGDRLDALYETEGLIGAPEGVDPYNYGLDATSTGSVPSGVIVFTGVKESHASTSNLYFWELSNLDKLEAYIPDFVRLTGTMTFAGFENVKEPDSFYTNTATPISIADGSLLPELHRFDFSTGKIGHYNGLSTESSARDLQYSSEAQLLAFTRMPEPAVTYADMALLKEWEVVIFDPISNYVVVDTIAGASDPQWSADGTQLIVTKEDGFYLYDLPSKELTKILGVNEGETLLSITMSDLSPDKKYFVWSSATAGVIAMNEITSWSPFEMKEIGRISGGGQYFYPQFSPDSNYYVVQAIDMAPVDSIERENPRLEVRPTLGRDIVGQLELDDFSFSHLITDDWIARTPIGLE